MEVTGIAEELRHAGGLLATGIAALGEIPGGGGPMRSLEGGAVALMSAMGRLGHTAQGIEQVMVTR